MVRWLEKNGYDVSYTTDSQSDSDGAQLLNHKVFISSGHDEYWSGERVQEPQSGARRAGVNVAFFSGNEMFWKTRWGPSIDGSNTPYRTLTTYKETHFNAPTDPQDPPTWTGAWGDPRFSPPADGGIPSNALTGQEFVVNQGTSDISVPYQYHALRIWRNTAVAKLTSGQSVTLSPGTGVLGYEWDVEADNGFQPPGEFQLSSTTVSGLQTFTDYGSTTIGPGAGGTETHHLTLYKAPSGALVFGAGTVQWSWGLDNTNAWDNFFTDPTGHAPDVTMEQATVNLFADMGAQPATLTLRSGGGTASSDTTPPTSTITSPAAGANLNDGAQVTVSGTATDAGGGVVAGVEISTDGGTTWHLATVTGADAQTVNWTYSWNVHGVPTTKIETRATDDSGNLETPSDAETVNVACPCSLFGSQTPPTPDAGDASAVEVGMKFTSDVSGTISGIRFYKSTANTGTHIGSLWTASGQLLAQATFTDETASGWQNVTFADPGDRRREHHVRRRVPGPQRALRRRRRLVLSEAIPAAGRGRWLRQPAAARRAPNNTSPNGLFMYTSRACSRPARSAPATTGSTSTSPQWLRRDRAPGPVTNVSATGGFNSATVSWTAPATGGTPTSYTVTPYIGSAAQTPVTVSGSPPATNATITGLTQGTAYTFTVQATNGSGSGPASAQSNSVTPSGPAAPPAPTNVTASPATGQAQVSWTAPNSNGSALTGYTITPFIGSAAQTPIQVNNGSATSATVTGLQNGTAYTFTVAATNGIGTSPGSAPSSAVTPQNTILDFNTPPTLDSGDTAAVELGVKFTARARVR